MKSLCVAAVLLLGSVSAWAAVGDIVTNANINFSNSIVNSTSSPKYSITGTVGSMTWERQWTFSPTIEDGILRFGNFDDYIDENTKHYGGGVVELQNNNIGAKDIVTIKFDLAFGRLSGKYVGFKFVDTEGEVILTQLFDAYNADFDDANPLSLDWNEMYHGSNEVLQERCVNFTITIDYSKNTIKTETTCLLSGSSKPATNGEHTVTLPSTTPIGKFVLMGNINNAARYSTIDNLLIQTKEGDYSTETAGYTINWVCNNQIVKTDNTRSGDVGASITLLPADKTSFTQGDTRYIYVSDDASSKTVAKGDGTVVTVTLREANKYNYSITTSYNSHMLAWSTSGSVWEDQNNVTFQVPRFQVYGETTLVEAPYGNNGTLNKTITVSENNYSYDVEFNITNITNLFLLSEAENLGTGISTNATSFTDRVSNKAIIHAASGTLLSLDPGKYIFTLGVIGGDNGSHKVNYTVSAGQTQIIDGTCTGNVLNLMASNEFTLFETTAITFTCSDPASSRGIDLVYIQKTGDVDASVAAAITDCEINANSSDFNSFIEGKFDAGELTTADDVYAAHTAWQIANGTLTDGIRDITGVIRNATINLDGTDWGSSRVIQLDEQQYPGAPDNYFIDAYEQELNTNQTIYGVPAGTYIIKAATRAAEGVPGTLYCNDGTSDIGKVNQINNVGNTGGDLGNGWSWSVMQFTLTETKDLLIGFWTNAGDEKWASCDDWHMYKVESVSTTLDVNGYATFASQYPLDLTNIDGATAYSAVVEGTNIDFNTLSQTVPANTGILLQGEPSATVTIPVVAEGAPVKNNALRVNASGETFAAETGYTYFAMRKDALADGMVVFGTFNPETIAIPANKAYLEVANTSASRLTVSFNGQATGINTVEAVEAETEGIYNLNGQRVAAPAKGLYIVNGKKVVLN